MIGRLKSSIVRPIVGPIVGRPAAGGSPYGNDMVLEFVTTTTPQTVTLRCANLGVFNASIDWGDGNVSAVSAYNDANLAHSYATAGTYLVRISGQFPNIKFDWWGEPLSRIYQLGATGLLSLNGAFAGSPILTDANVLGSVGVNDLSLVTDCQSAFGDCSAMVNPPDMSGLTAAITSLNYAFASCSSLAAPIDVSNWDTSALTDAGTAFGLVPSAVLSQMAFENWDVSALTTASQFMAGSSFSTAKYDLVLIAWAAQSLNSGVSVHFGTSTYTNSGAALAARNTLTGTYTWTIIDGGPA